MNPSALLLCALFSAFAQSPQAEGQSIETVEPTTPQNADYAAGVAALQAKDSKTAIDAFARCLQTAPAEVKTECLWEKGWAHWVAGEWTETVQSWEAVQKVDPDRAGLVKYMKQAKDNMGLKELLAKGRASAPATFASDVPEGTTIRLRAVGDMMIGTDFPAGKLPPEGQDSFGDVAGWLQDADVTFGNLEGPVCDGGSTSKCKPGAPAGSCYAFRTPSKYMSQYTSAGFDVMSTANNHAGDFGETCRAQTEQHLDAAGIAHSGRPGDIASMEINGLKVAMIAFHTSRSCHYINDHETAATLVRALSTDHDIVIVSFHGGAEGKKAIHVPHHREKFYGEDRGHLREFTHIVIDAGADLVLGHGPHVLRAMEVYNGRLIAYSLGNFATYGRFNLSGLSGLGVVLEVTLGKDGTFVGGKLLPTRQKMRGVPFQDETKEALDVVRALSEQDFPTTGIQVAQDGTIAAR